jgi:hypothetical protein
MEFDQFMAIPPCTRGKHTDEKPAEAKPAPAAEEAPAMTASSGGVETYGSTPAASAPASVPTSTVPSKAPTPPPVEDEEDDLSLPVPEGAKCKRLGCGAAWQGAEVSRGDGPDAACTYHPQKVAITPRQHELTSARLPRGLQGLPVLQAARARV